MIPPASIAPRTESPPVIERLLRGCARAPSWASWFVLATLLFTVWILVVAAGGAVTATPHLFYVPIIGAALTLRWPGALCAAIASGVLAGPLMYAGPTQSVANMVLRTVIFVLVGMVAAGAIHLSRRLLERQIAAELREAMTGRPVGSGAAVDVVLIERVQRVLRAREFHVVFQPIYCLDDARLIAVEALARFHAEPRRSPDQWFAAAARAGIGPDLEIAAVAAAIDAATGLPAGVYLSVNASPQTVADDRFRDLVVGAGRPIAIELTEHVAIADYAALRADLEPLRDAGALVAVDDAGAGIASMQHIVQITPDIIKIDRSLTQDMATSQVRRALGHTLIDFGHQIGAKIVVESIETRGDLTIWADLGADAAQGFVFGQPGPLPAPSTSREVALALGLSVKAAPPVPTQRGS